MKTPRFHIMPISTFHHYKVVEYDEAGRCQGQSGTDFSTYAEAVAHIASQEATESVPVTL